MGLLDIFIKSEQVPAQAPANTTPASLPVQQAVYQAPLPVQPAPPTGMVDTKFMKHLESVLDKANIPGADFYEFSKTLEGMSAMNLPEEQTYKMAYIAFKAMNPGQDDNQLITLLSSTANQYLSILQKDKTDFDAVIQSQTGEKVGVLQQEQEKLVSRQASIEQEVARLQEERQQNQEALIKVGSEIAVQTSRINANHSNYNVSYDAVTKAITGVVERIGRYCGVTV